MTDDPPLLSREFFKVLGDVNAAVETQFTTYPETLVHYTSVANAINIITSKAIYLFNARTLNDNQELEHAVELIQQTTKNRLSRSVRDAVVDGFEFYQRRQGSVYVFCLAEPSGPKSKETHDRLAMWRAYGDDGNGVAIEVFCEGIAKAKIQNPSGVTLGKVFYREKPKNQLIRLVVNAFKDACARHGISEDRASFVLSAALWRIAPFLKHEAFEEEKEWRAVVELSSSPVLGVPDGRKLIAFHDTRPYVRLDLCGKKLGDAGGQSQFFRGALVGPSPHQGVNIAKVAAALLASEPAGEYAATSASSIPYRGKA